MAFNIDRSVFQQNQKSGLRQTDPRAFTAGAQGLIQLGQGLQDVGDAGAKFALAENQALQTTRSQRILADFTAYEISTANKLRETAPADQFEALYNQDITSWIKNTLDGNAQTGAPGLSKGIFKTSVTQSLEAQRLTRLRPIANEARVRRLKSEKAGVESTILLLQQAYGATFGDRNPASELTRQGLVENIEGLIQGMADATLIDPDDAVAKKQKNASNLQVAEAKFLQRAAPEEAIEYLLGNKSVNIDERVRQEMIKSTDAILVRAAAASARQEEKDERADKALLKANQNESYATLIAEASRGDITATQIAEQLTSGAIRGTQGASLIEFIGKYPDGISDPEQIKNVQKQLLLNPDVLSIEQILSMDGLNRDDAVKLAKEKQQIDAEPKETKDFKDGRNMILNIYKQDPDHWADEKEQYKIVATENYKKLVKEGRTPFLAAVESINNLNLALKKDKSPESPISVMGRNRLLGRMNYGGDSYVDAAVKLKAAIAEAMQENGGVLLPDQDKFFKQQGLLLQRIRKLTPQAEQSLPVAPGYEAETAAPREAIRESGKPAVKTAEPREIVQPIQEQVKEVVEPIKETLQSLKKSISNSETGPETLNRLTNEGLQALGMQEEPQLSPEAMFHVSLTAKDLAIKKDFPDEFLLRKYRELFESTDPDEVAIFKKLEAEVRRRGLPEG